MAASSNDLDVGGRTAGGWPSGRRPHLAALAVVLLVVALTIWHGVEASQHLLTDRDPGVYVTAGRWLAGEGTLLVDPAVGPFATGPGLVFEEQGWNLNDDGRLEPQFLHLLPVLLAATHLLGGDRLLLLAPPFLAGAALLATYAFARRVVRPWWALAVTAGLALTLPWVHLSRDAFSEPLAVLFLFAGLSVLWGASERGSWPRAAVAGLLLGGVAMARVEGFVLLLPLLAYVAIELVASERAAAAERRGTRRLMGALVAGVAVTAGLAVVDLVAFSTWYLDDLGGLLRTVAAGLALTVVAGAGAVALAARRQGRPSPPPRPEVTPPRAQVALVAAAGVVVLVAGLWFVRPLAQTVTGEPSAAIAAIELEEGRGAEGVRRYSEQSVAWLAWYLGPVALVVGVAGLALSVHRLVRSSAPDRRLLPFLLVFATISILYLWRPSITPDHIWAMRRYAIVTLPGLAGLAAVAGQAAKDRLASGGRTTIGLAAGAAAVLALVAFPATTLLPVAGATTQEGMLQRVLELCDVVGPDGAVVVVPGGALELVAGQTLRSFCGVPVAIAGDGFGAAEVRALAEAWLVEGRTLHLVGADPAAVEALAGSPATTFTVANDEVLEGTLTSRPDELLARPITFAVAPVATPTP